jgi:hypothetical protein
MTATQSLNLYNISLRYFKNEADAASFVKEIEVVVDNKFENRVDVLATKEDVSNLLKWIVGLFIPLYLSIIGLIVTLLLRH